MEVLEIEPAVQERLASVRGIAAAIDQHYEAFMVAVIVQKESNEVFRTALAKYGGIGMFKNFTFQCYDPRSVGFGREQLFEDNGTTLLEFAELNQDFVDLSQLEEAKREFLDRIRQIMEIIQTDCTDPVNAKAAMGRIHKQLILPVLNSAPAFRP